jgi:DNA adenine methylase
MYDQALAGWRRIEREALADGARKRTEVLWINPAACNAASVAQAQHDMFTSTLSSQQGNCK